MHPTSFIRLLCDPPQDGATNMAADDTLVDSVGQGLSSPTLRLYRWAPPCISLGYFQKFEDVQHLTVPLSLKQEVVRRVTGGGAIIHDQELTYSLCLPANHPLAGREPRPLYELVHRVAIEAAGLLGVALSFRGQNNHAECETRNAEKEGAVAAPLRIPHSGFRVSSPDPFLCFHRWHDLDLVAGGLKVMGSAQRRTRAAVMQHGSLITVRRYHEQHCLSLSMLAGRPITWEATVEAFVQAWATMVPQHPLTQGEWTDAELFARWSAVAKHRSAEWVQMR